MKQINYCILLLLMPLIVFACGSKNKQTEKETSKTQNTSTQSGPSESEIENEVFYLVSRIPYDNYGYNASIFLDRDGVYKNLAVTTVRVVNRSEPSTAKDGLEQKMTLQINGIADAYDVTGFNSLRYAGRTNFAITKEFSFIKKNERWVGYVYDNVRNKKTLRFEKDYIRYR